MDDAADALVWLLKTYSGDSHVNVGSGEDVTIAELARAIVSAVGADAEISFDPTKPDGTPRKLVDTTTINALGWQAKISLNDGLAAAYQWFAEHYREARI